MGRLDGGPAFPFKHHAPDGVEVLHEGASLRDLFAGKALVMAGLLIDSPPGKTGPEKVAEVAFKIADAMIIRRGDPLPIYGAAVEMLKALHLIRDAADPTDVKRSYWAMRDLASLAIEKAVAAGVPLE